MRILRAILAAVVVLGLVVGIGVGGLLAWVTARALPVTSGTLRLAGLSAPVTVVRDANGIAQLTAETPADLFRAQGYVHAQERLWQMELLRHAASGRLAELFGKRQVDTDRLIRTLGWRQAAERDLAALSGEARADLQAYADGVNAYIDAHQGSLGLSFVVSGLFAGGGAGLGGYTPEPWSPLDTLAFAKLQAWSLGGDFTEELFRELLVGRGIAPDAVADLFPAYPAGAPVIVPTGGPGSGGPGATGASGTTGGTPGAPAVASAVPPPEAPVELAGWRRLSAADSTIRALLGQPTAVAGSAGIGSNEWAVAPSLSATGHALLANDPHLGVSMPSIWFLNGLHCRTVSSACPFDVAGVTFPGVPGVVLGHNARIAWGATNVNPDVEDLFRERVDPADPQRYLTPDGSAPFETRTETIKVAGGDDVTFEVRSTHHGPIVNDAIPELTGAGTLYALSWTGTDAPDRIVETFLELDRAADFTDFRAALSKLGAPSQNFLYADVDGHIGYQMPGRIPIRAYVDPLGLPANGWDGRGDWTGAIPYDDLPRLYDPPSGIIVTANNAVVDGRYPYFIGNGWDPGWRAERIAELLATATAAGPIDLDTFAAIQMDDRLLRADDLVEAVGRAEPSTSDGRTVRERIAAWDRHCDVDSRGCAAYEVFEYALLRYLFDDDLGDLARDYVGSDASRLALRNLLADDPRSAWWDRRDTPDRVETAGDLVRAALDQAGRLLSDALGQDGRWTWGRVHTLTFREPSLGESGIGPLAWYFDSGPYAAPGSADAVNATSFDLSAAYPDPDDPGVAPAGLTGIFEAVAAPSYRLAIDLGDLDGTRIVNTTGNSGNPFDRHYGDLIDDWLTGRSVRLAFSADAVSRSAVATLTLVP